MGVGVEGGGGGGKAARVCSVLRSYVEVEVAVLGSPSLIVLMVSVDVKQH